MGNQYVRAIRGDQNILDRSAYQTTVRNRNQMNAELGQIEFLLDVSSDEPNSGQREFENREDGVRGAELRGVVIPRNHDDRASELFQASGLDNETANRRPGWAALVKDIAGVDDQINRSEIEDIIDHLAVGILDINRADITPTGISPKMKSVTKMSIGDVGDHSVGHGVRCGSPVSV